MEHKPADRASDPFIGRLLDGRYLIGSRIARGGMATVYEARDTRLDRTVAVKIMHPGMGEDDEFARRFKREARAAAKLAHNNVVAVFDQGEDDGTLYLVMEYVPGRTLRDLIRHEAPVSALKALTLIDPVLQALTAAHAAGLVHRDVKPENVLLADDGAIKVTDFGLAKAINSETQATTGALMGTVSYLSPELVAEGYADERADVYSAGVLIYELITGQKPHRADNPIQVAYKHVHEDIPPPSEVIPGLPAYVDALVARATARDMSLRPADAGVLLQQVRRVAYALERGVVEDSELTHELTPGTAREDFAAAAPNTTVLPASAPPPLPEAPVEEVYDQYSDPDEGAPIWAGQSDPSLAPEPPLAAPITPRLPTPQAANFRRPPGRRISAHRRRRLLVVGLALLALLIGGYWLLVARYTATPSVIELTQTEASAKLQQSGLKLKVGGYDYSETVTKDSVIRTSPGPGGRILDGGTVVAVLSRGPERHEVPALRGKSLDTAQQLLIEAALAQGQVSEKYSETVPDGKIIESKPPAGTQLRRDTAVDLVVSKGRRPIKIPNFTDKPAKAALKTLRKLGFQVSTTQSFSDTVAEGLVITQSPKSGAGFRGDVIKLEVSKGPELVRVPDVRRMGVAAARKLLKGAGFRVQAVRSEVWIGLQYVLKSNPAGGTMAPKGSVVTIYLV